MRFDIEKRAEELIQWTSFHGDTQRTAALQLAREAVDAALDEVVEWGKAEAKYAKAWKDGDGEVAFLRCAQRARSLKSAPPPQTREHELEEALRELTKGRCWCVTIPEGAACVFCKARRVLERKP